jgi:adenylate kinase family enzyme
MVKDRLGEVDCKENGWLLDGFPRTGAQAEALVDIGVSPDYVLLLDVPDEQLIKRVVSPPPALYFFFIFFSLPLDVFQHGDSRRARCDARQRPLRHL